MTVATRGDLAYALFNALGIDPTGTGQFNDSGYLDAAVTTLADLGITNGVNANEFGTMQPTTRGQAFTMIARALGLADASTSIADASRALVQAGIVRGYGNDPNNLGLDDELSDEHLGLLIERLGPELSRETADGSTVLDGIRSRADQQRDQRRARQDPAYAAYLAQQGVDLADIDTRIRELGQQFTADWGEIDDNGHGGRMGEVYDEMRSQSSYGTSTDFENRGLFRSGTRRRVDQQRQGDITRQQADAFIAAQRAREQAEAELSRRRGAIVREGTRERIGAETRGREGEIEETYGG